VTDLKRRWIEDKAVKEAGWPIHVVKSCIDADPTLVEKWDSLLAALGRKITGTEDAEFASGSGADPYQIDPDEVEAMGASFADPTQLIMPLFSAPATLHIVVSSEDRYPRPGHTPMFLTSATIPAYVRLHLISQLLLEIDGGDFIQPGEGFCMAAMRVLEAVWAVIEDDGPPDMSVVLRHILPAVEGMDYDDTQLTVPRSSTKGRDRRKGGNHRRDERTSSQIKQEFEAARKDSKVWKTIPWSALLLKIISTRIYWPHERSSPPFPPRTSSSIFRRRTEWSLWLEKQVCLHLVSL
jgi:hypothetical protein